MLSNLRFLLLLCTAFTAVIKPCHAANDREGFYVGAAIGNMDISLDAPVEPSDQAYAVGPFMGVNFSNWLGLEFSLYTTGNLSIATERDDQRALLFSITPKFSIPVSSRVDLFFKTGLAMVDFSDDRYDDFLNPWSGDSFSDSAPGWPHQISSHGLGGNIRLSRGLNLRLGVDYFKGEVGIDDVESLDGFTYAEVYEAEITQGYLAFYYQF